MKVAANIKYLRISAQKLRLGADMVRGKRALDAQETLLSMPQKSAQMIASGLKSIESSFATNHIGSKAKLLG